MNYKQEYLNYWKSIYGVDINPNPTDRAALARFAYVRRKGGVNLKPEEAIERFQEETRRERMEAFEEKIRKRTLTREEKVGKEIKRYLRQECEEKPEVPAAQIVKLTLHLKDGTKRTVCHDIIELYTYLKNTYRNEQEWKDPKYSVTFTQHQIRLIQERYRTIECLWRKFDVFTSVGLMFQRMIEYFVFGI